MPISQPPSSHALAPSCCSQFARVQGDAAALAIQFNRRVNGQRAWNIAFLPTHIYSCIDTNYAGGKMWLLVEPELEGRFTKWNNNAGAVMAAQTGPSGAALSAGSALGGIDEEDEDDEAEEAIDINDVPQAFSHFSFEASCSKQLVCDLQGVWNAEDGFVLTDPVVHYISSTGKRHKNGATDQGVLGVRKFFQTHTCNRLCARLGLRRPSPGSFLDDG